MSISPPPRINQGSTQRVVLTPTETKALSALYNIQEAWTHDEAVAAFGDRLCP
ncbi:hypothetical protein [Deinococcus alpinitundrae]|uniref:hypothetical protein n=1 Tax=Deinococcus alpinitundrae TaxID=468913 RepID=UPI00137B70B6|nr:hypothetical protein [Deinococcus alpinitundrae]